MHTDRFDFDTLTSRDAYASAKWARRTPEEKAAGIVPLSVADMEFKAPPAVQAAVVRAAEHGLYGYCDADDEYLQAVADWMKTRHGWSIEKNWIVPENGVVPAMCVAVRAFTRPGDGVLIQAPAYQPFAMAAELNGREPIYTAMTQDEGGLWRTDLADLREKAADPRVHMLFLCSPHNPTGRIWTVEELRAIGEICLEHDLLVVSDEIHADLALHGTHVPFCEAVPEMRGRCVICTAPSKTFNLAGLQAANMIIPDETLREAYNTRMHADGFHNISYFGRHATVAAYREGAPWLDAAIAYIRDNFAFLGAWLGEHMPRVRLTPPQGTYLAWLDCTALGMPEDALMEMVRGEAMIVPNPGTMFGAAYDGFLRLNLAVPRSVLEGALERLLAAAKRHGVAGA